MQEDDEWKARGDSRFQFLKSFLVILSLESFELLFRVIKTQKLTEKLVERDPWKVLSSFHNTPKR